MKFTVRKRTRLQTLTRLSEYLERMMANFGVEEIQGVTISFSAVNPKTRNLAPLFGEDGDEIQVKHFAPWPVDRSLKKRAEIKLVVDNTKERTA